MKDDKSGHLECGEGEVLLLRPDKGHPRPDVVQPLPRLVLTNQRCMLR